MNNPQALSDEPFLLHLQHNLRLPSRKSCPAYDVAVSALVASLQTLVLLLLLYHARDGPAPASVCLFLSVCVPPIVTKPPPASPPPA